MMNTVMISPLHPSCPHVPIPGQAHHHNCIHCISKSCPFSEVICFITSQAESQQNEHGKHNKYLKYVEQLHCSSLGLTRSGDICLIMSLVPNSCETVIDSQFISGCRLSLVKMVKETKLQQTKTCRELLFLDLNLNLKQN